MPNSDDGRLPGVDANILIVEESPVVALELQSILEDLGARAAVAESVDGAARLSGDIRPDIAFIDIAIGNSDNLEFAQRLLASGSIVVLTSGQLDPRSVPDALSGCMIVEKPYAFHHIERALRAVLASG